MALAQVIVAVGYAFGARAAGPSAFGQTISAIAIGATAAGLLDLGLSALQTRELAAGRASAAVVAARLIDRTLIAVLLVGVSLVLGVVVPGGAQLLVWASLVMLGTLLTQFVQVPLRALGRANLVAVATLADKAVFGAVVVVLLSAGAGGGFAVIVGVLGGLGTDILVCLYATLPGRVRTIGRVVRTSTPRRWMHGWRGVGGYGLAAAVTSAQQIDVPLVSAVGGAGAAGVYGAVSRWTTPLLLPASAIAQVGVAHAAAARTTREAVTSLSRVVWILVVAALGSVVVAVFATPLTVLILGAAYEASANVLRILALATLPTLMAQPLVMIVESRRREGAVALALLLALAVRLGVAAALSDVLGGIAGALGVLFQQALTCGAVALLAISLLRQERKVANP